MRERERERDVKLYDGYSASLNLCVLSSACLVKLDFTVYTVKINAHTHIMVKDVFINVIVQTSIVIMKKDAYCQVS